MHDQGSLQGSIVDYCLRTLWGHFSFSFFFVLMFWVLGFCDDGEGSMVNARWAQGYGFRLWVAEMQTYLLGFGSTIKTPCEVSILPYNYSKKHYFNFYILESLLIQSLHFNSSQLGPYYFQVTANQVSTINSLTKNIHVANSVHCQYT